MNILIIDDNKSIRETLSAMVVDNGHNAILADGHQQAMVALSESDVDMMLMDIEMPELNGYQLTIKIRETYSEWIPIIFLSANNSEEGLVKGIDAGGDDYLTKPINQTILNAKIRAMERIALMQAELAEANKHLARLSHIDSLTQLLNRRGLDTELQKAWSSNQRHEDELSLLMIDIDFFKSYNDNYGHQQGDECLQKVAEIIDKSINRNTDIVARYGGEEFLVILPSTPIYGAKIKATHVLQNLRKNNLKHDFSEVTTHVTLSIGVTSSSLQAKTVNEMIEQADSAMYKAKSLGRDRLICYKPALGNEC